MRLSNIGKIALFVKNIQYSVWHPNLLMFKIYPILSCHSEQSDESGISATILRCAQNDKELLDIAINKLG